MAKYRNPDHSKYGLCGFCKIQHNGICQQEDKHHAARRLAIQQRYEGEEPTREESDAIAKELTKYTHYYGSPP